MDCHTLFTRPFSKEHWRITFNFRHVWSGLKKNVELTKLHCYCHCRAIFYYVTCVTNLFIPFTKIRFQEIDNRCWKRTIEPFNQIMISAYNLPRFFEVKVCKFTQCDNYSFILDPSLANNSSDISNTDLTSCFNATDVVKTELRENNIYISVSEDLISLSWISLYPPPIQAHFDRIRLIKTRG